MIIRNGYVITPTASGSGGGTYKIKVAELPNVTFQLLMGSAILQTKYTPAVTGGIVTFNVTDTGIYTIKALNTSSEELWTADVTVDVIGIYNVKVPDSSSGYALNRYTNDELHLICQNGYFSTMFDVKSKWNFVQSGSIMNNYDYFVEDVEQNAGKEEVLFRSCSPYQSGSYNINPRFSYLASSSATAFVNTYSSAGGMKYSAMRQRFMLQGEEVYSQATSLKPDDSTLTVGIPFSQLYYSDSDETSKIYTYVSSTDSFTEDTEFTYFSSSSAAQTGCKFIKGYFKSVGTLTEEQFNSGHYYSYNSSTYVYTLETTYSSSTSYYGFYKTLQENGIFVSAHSSLLSYLKRLDDKASTGLTNTTYVSNYSDYIDIPTVEQITGTNRSKTLFSSRNKSSTTSGGSIYSYNIPGEGTKRPAYDSFDLQATGYYYWTASTSSNYTYGFCFILNYGGIDYYSVHNTNYVRPGFKFS
jgi:hypothetical protein